MRIILILWVLPLVFFWGWYGLSANDINFGSFFLTRDFHDRIFAVYGAILHMPPAEVPVKLAWAFFIDTLIILAIAAYRWRKSWYPGFKTRMMELTGRETEGNSKADAGFATGQANPAE